MEKSMKCWFWCFNAKKEKKKGFHNFCALRGNKLVSKIPKFVFRKGGFAPRGLPSGALLPLHSTGVLVAPGPSPFRLGPPQALFSIPMPDDVSCDVVAARGLVMSLVMYWQPVEWWCLLWCTGSQWIDVMDLHPMDWGYLLWWIGIQGIDDLGIDVQWVDGVPCDRWALRRVVSMQRSSMFRSTSVMIAWWLNCIYWLRVLWLHSIHLIVSDPLLWCLPVSDLLYCCDVCLFQIHCCVVCVLVKQHSLN